MAEPASVVYVVVPEAVYDHGVIGVFPRLEDAHACVSAFWRDSDGHHSLRIEEWPVGGWDFARGPLRKWGSAASVSTPARVEFIPWDASTPEEH